jgi:hypothetical protein
VLGPDTDSALYIWKHYLFPDEFLAMDIDAETAALENISRRQHGRPSLLRLQTLAANSIGIIKREDERIADRLTVNAWIAQIESLEAQLKPVARELVRLAEQLPGFASITSLNGVGKILAALFLANVRDLSRFTHFKQIEKLAGANLRLSDSGRYRGMRHISHLGNRRLLWVLYKMTEGGARAAHPTGSCVPEVRIKYLTRQIKRRKHRKNVVACIPQTLQLIMALVRENRTYQVNDDMLSTLKELEQRYAAIKRSTSDGHAQPLKRITLRKACTAVL